MGLRFESPWFLLLIIPLFFLVIFMMRGNFRLSGGRKKFAVGVRMLIIAFLVFSLSGLESFISIERKAIIFVVDRSDSMTGHQDLTNWMASAASYKADEDEVGVISIGANALIERSPSNRDLQTFGLNTMVNRQFTNLASALQLAESMIPDQSSARIVLLSDGQENVGDMIQQGILLRDKGIPVDVVITDDVVLRDVAVERLNVPEQLYQGEKYSLEVSLQSTYATEGELRIYEDNLEISSQLVQIEKGENRFVLQSIAKQAGFHRYRAEIYVADDEQAVNNASYAFSRVVGPPKVLVVEAEPESSHNLISILSSSLIPYELIRPEMLSQDYANYSGYESIIFNNVSAANVSESQMLMIEQAVRDFGIGFMMIGGEESFGLGGYFKTPIERVLPVYMDLRGKREIPSLGLILVIDKSGSMGGERIELAREAALRTVELLRDQDTVGVVAFDSSPWWVVEPQLLTNREEVMTSISSIQADGGTEIYTAVETGLSKLIDVEAQRKHIILLTDGMSATNQSYEALTATMKDEQITISTVGIGEGSDQQLLEHIAQLGGGRYYFTNEQSTIPAIFSREAVLISRTYIVDQPFVPTVAQGGDWRYLFQHSLPEINAYIATTIKETAEAVLNSPEPDPLLARWQYGAGKSVAWTSDLSGKWSSEWLQWDGLPQAFAEIVKWTFPQFHTSPFQLTSRLEGERVIVEVKSNAPGFQGELKAIISDESLTQHEMELIPSLPGEYYAEFDVSASGAYLMRIDVYDDRIEQPAHDAGDGEGAEASDDVGDGLQFVGSVTSGFVIPYSPEYKLFNHTEANKMERLAELTGGRVLSLEHPEEVFEGKVVPQRIYYDLSLYLLIAALLFWLIDIANRRLSIPWKRLLYRNYSGGKKDATYEQRTNNRAIDSRMDGNLQHRKSTQEPMVVDKADMQKQEHTDNKMQAGTQAGAQGAQESQEDRMSRLLAAKKRTKR